jgi:hypothetical protein
MTFAEFKKKWSRYQGKETSAYQSHFDDLCRALGYQTPSEADPSGNDFFCYQKGVLKDAELFDIETPDASEPRKRGFPDVPLPASVERGKHMMMCHGKENERSEICPSFRQTSSW